MKTKNCSVCKKEKPIIEFYKNKNHRDGLNYVCKICFDRKIKIYYLKNKEKILERGKKYILTHKKQKSDYAKIYRKTHKKEIKLYRQTHKDKITKLCKKYHELHKQEIKKRKKEYNRLHQKERNLNNKNRRKIDINFKIRGYLASRLHLALKGNPKLSTTMNLLGCSLDFFKQHLESKFKPGMTWSNYGFYGWHIDHIKPCCSFDLSKKSEQKKCFHYTNLQPLWALENLTKNKY